MKSREQLYCPDCNAVFSCEWEHDTENDTYICPECGGVFVIDDIRCTFSDESDIVF